LLSIGETSLLLGVSISTLRRWHKSGYLIPKYRTEGSHRRYDIKDIRKLLNEETKEQIDKTICYARVSTAGQSNDLEFQALRLEQYCISNKYNYEVIKDKGSGINFKKKGLTRLIQLIITNQINRIVLVTQDRLLRFGNQLIINLCEHFNTEVVILDEMKTQDRDAIFVDNVLEILTVFVASRHGRRSHKNKRAVMKK